jgi:hypothetical protein
MVYSKSFTPFEIGLWRFISLHKPVQWCWLGLNLFCYLGNTKINHFISSYLIPLLGPLSVWTTPRQGHPAHFAIELGPPREGLLPRQPSIRICLGPQLFSLGPRSYLPQYTLVSSPPHRISAWGLQSYPLSTCWPWTYKTTCPLILLVRLYIVDDLEHLHHWIWFIGTLQTGHKVLQLLT